MKLVVAGNVFDQVEVPVLWGKRAILQDRKQRLSVVDLSGLFAQLEILGDKPAPGARYSLTLDGFAILGKDGTELYQYSPTRRTLTDSTLGLLDLQLSENTIRIGTNTFSNNIMHGFAVGLVVDGQGIAVGAPLPPGLARLQLPA